MSTLVCVFWFDAHQRGTLDVVLGLIVSMGYNRCCTKQHAGHRSRSTGARYPIINDDNVELYICGNCVRNSKLKTE